VTAGVRGIPAAQETAAQAGDRDCRHCMSALGSCARWASRTPVSKCDPLSGNLTRACGDQSEVHSHGVCPSSSARPAVPGNGHCRREVVLLGTLGVAPFKNPVTHISRTSTWSGIRRAPRVCNPEWNARRAFCGTRIVLFDSRYPGFGPIGRLFAAGPVEHRNRQPSVVSRPV